MATVKKHSNFNQSVFGGEIPYMSAALKNMPAGVEPLSLSRVKRTGSMHVSLPISKETILMGSDTGVNGHQVFAGK
jgi:PhnB protein